MGGGAVIEIKLVLVAILVCIGACDPKPEREPVMEPSPCEFYAMNCPSVSCYTGGYCIVCGVRNIGGGVICYGFDRKDCLSTGK